MAACYNPTTVVGCGPGSYGSVAIGRSILAVDAVLDSRSARAKGPAPEIDQGRIAAALIARHVPNCSDGIAVRMRHALCFRQSPARLVVRRFATFLEIEAARPSSARARRTVVGTASAYSSRSPHLRLLVCSGQTIATIIDRTGSRVPRGRGIAALAAENPNERKR
jgi:hypothetical protein